MTHCSDDDLVLEYYGESSEASAHVAMCAACAERARDLASLLGTLDEPVPARSAEYGREVWDRVQPHLDARGAGLVTPAEDRGASVVSLDGAGRTRPAGTNIARFSLRGNARWALAAAATLALVASAFFAGRLSVQPEPAVSAPTHAAVNTADTQMARRVLLMSVADHLERSDRVLTDIMNGPAADISVEQQWAGDLIAANRLFRQDALDANEASVANVLDELERALLDVVHRPADAPADLDQIRRRIDSAALLFKVRVLTNELRERELGSDVSSTSTAVPIS
jgi:hypothetical protein